MDKFLNHINNELNILIDEGGKKKEYVINSPQQAKIKLLKNQEKLNFCANNYLNLANNKELINASKKSLDLYGFGMASVRFICGTQNNHKVLEKKIADFVGFEDAILYSSCFDANGGLFETLFNDQDIIISDALNHASIIDGIRLCKAKRARYKNSDMQNLEDILKTSADFRFRIIVTDGVFSMDGLIANLPVICDLAQKYQALVMVDDSHAIGVLGKNGRGTAEHYHLHNKVDIMTGTFGKALGGASGGYTLAKKQVIELLRQKSRPYLFSNSLAPAITSSTIKALEILSANNYLLKKLKQNTDLFHHEMKKLEFNLTGGEHPIIPIILGNAKIAQRMAEEMLTRGIYVIAFFYPVVPKEKARIRVQISAAHSSEDILKAVEIFAEVGKKLKII